MIVIIILFVAPIFVLLFLRWNFLRLEDEIFKVKYGALYTNIKTNPKRPD
jgi:membrane protein YdbS with pleckstrin-like domain